MRGRLRYLVPLVLWMGLIFAASTDRGSSAHSRPLVASILRRVAPSLAARMSPETVDRVDFLLRKAGHVCEYGILGFLALRAFRGGRPGKATPQEIGMSLAVAIGFAASDEWHQSFVPSRGATPVDVLYDAAGATSGVFVRHLQRRK